MCWVFSLVVERDCLLLELGGARVCCPRPRMSAPHSGVADACSRSRGEQQAGRVAAVGCGAALWDCGSGVPCGESLLSLVPPWILYFYFPVLSVCSWLSWVLLLCPGFLYLGRAGGPSRFGAQASRWGVFSCGTQALGVRDKLLCVIWDLPRPGVEPVSPALAGGFLSPGHQGSPGVCLA